VKREEVVVYLRGLQDSICAGLLRAEGAGAVSESAFKEDTWERPGGGGGRSRVLEGGALFEKAGVNFSEVHGEVTPQMEKSLPGTGGSFFATGISLVIHPRSPMVPAVHANWRFLSRGETAWFGGGSDLTPYYVWEDDARHFHRVWKAACDSYAPDAYARFKDECDRYFHLPHRGETRGVGGIFFDYLGQGGEDLARVFDFVRGCGNSFLDAYLPIVERRRAEAWGENERDWQCVRRGRYVEFNLIYDRGTTFGLKSGGRIESILMSLPPEVRWKYDHRPAPGSREAGLLEYLKPRDWLGVS
jgi:coproporphyrinogen III oxidase